MPILLLGLTVLASCASLLLFLVRCIGRWIIVDMGHFGVSYLKVLILFEQCGGHRLLSEKVRRPHVRANRPISCSSVQFVSSLVRALASSLVV